MLMEVAGPPQIWNEYLSQSSGSMTPLIRLYRADRYGLIVGPGSRCSGGVNRHVADRLIKRGDAYSRVCSDGITVKIYPKQYSLPFDHFYPWKTWRMRYHDDYRTYSS